MEKSWGERLPLLTSTESKKGKKCSCFEDKKNGGRKKNKQFFYTNGGNKDSTLFFWWVGFWFPRLLPLSLFLFPHFDGLVEIVLFFKTLKTRVFFCILFIVLTCEMFCTTSRNGNFEERIVCNELFG